MRTLWLIPVLAGLVGACGISKEDHDKQVQSALDEQKARLDAEMKKAQALELRYTRDMKAAKKALATAEAKLAKLMNHKRQEKRYHGKKR